MSQKDIKITKDNELSLMAVKTAKVLAELDTVFGSHVIDTILNSHNKEILVSVYDSLCRNWEEQLLYVNHIQLTVEKSYFVNVAAETLRQRKMLIVLLNGYYGDDYYYYVKRCKEHLPMKLEINEIKDIIRIVLSCMYDLMYFKHYCYMNRKVNQDKELDKRFYLPNGDYDKYIRSIKTIESRKGLILSDRYQKREKWL